MSAQPKSIEISKDPAGISILWSDNHRSIYPFSFLRKACPCALCRGEKTPLDLEPLALPVLKPLSPLAFEAKDMFRVGRYAIGFKWGDGHDTGIYAFDSLRKICPCEACLSEK